jgi:hypothetical protein
VRAREVRKCGLADLIREVRSMPCPSYMAVHKPCSDARRPTTHSRHGATARGEVRTVATPALHQSRQSGVHLGQAAVELKSFEALLEAAPV